MFAYRWTWIIKQGSMKEALELQKALSFRPDYAKMRLYTPDISPNVLVFELNVESDEARSKFFAEFNATPEAETFWKKWRALGERMVSLERWEVWEPE
jgi:hypothetical protein